MNEWLESTEHEIMTCIGTKKVNIYIYIYICIILRIYVSVIGECYYHWAWCCDRSLSSPPLFSFSSTSSLLLLFLSFFHSFILISYSCILSFFAFWLYPYDFPLIERVPITTTAYHSAWLSFLLLWEFTPRFIGRNLPASLASLIFRISCSPLGYYHFDLLHRRPVVPGLTIAREWPVPILFLQVGGILRLPAFFFFFSLFFSFFLSGGSWSFLPCFPVLL